MSTLLDNIQSVLTKLGEPSYRLKQIQQAIYQQGILDYEKMSNLSLSLRTALKQELGDVLSLKVLARRESNQASKILFETKDGAKLEAVKMTFNPGTDEEHESICISSQSGCPLGCKFCFTGTMGFIKNLTAQEITDQVLYFRSHDHFKGSISFMGMGEPFLNEEEVFKALELLMDPSTFAYGARKISISTVGIIPGIEKLTKTFPQVNLAFSLHSPFDEERAQWMPINQTYPLKKVMQALDQHISKTHRRVFLAYLLLKNKNDDDRHAQALVDLIQQRSKLAHLYHVNLIPFHGGEDSVTFRSSSKKAIEPFIHILEKNGIHYSLRQSFGADIEAACGQLCVKE